jgi:hypothetical protein
MPEESAAEQSHLTEASHTSEIGPAGLATGSYARPVEPAVGWAIIAASTTILLVTALVFRTRLGPRVVDAVLAATGAGLGIGGLFVVGDAGLGSWIVGPPALAVFTVVHVRALFAGSGPFRT